MAASRAARESTLSRSICSSMAKRVELQYLIFEKSNKDENEKNS